MQKRRPHTNSKQAGKKRAKRDTPNLGVEPVLFYRKEVKMSRFWDLVKDSTIVQGLITLAVVLTTCYLWVSGQPVPQELWTANGIILGFFFGAKATQIVRR